MSESFVARPGVKGDEKSKQNTAAVRRCCVGRCRADRKLCERVVHYKGMVNGYQRRH